MNGIMLIVFTSFFEVVSRVTLFSVHMVINKMNKQVSQEAFKVIFSCLCLVFLSIYCLAKNRMPERKDCLWEKKKKKKHKPDSLCCGQVCCSWCTHRQARSDRAGLLQIISPPWLPFSLSTVGMSGLLGSYSAVLSPFSASFSLCSSGSCFFFFLLEVTAF